MAAQSGREIWATLGRAGPVPSPRVMYGDVLYLDFDGVLHHQDVRVSHKHGIHFGPEAYETGRKHTLFEHAPLLEQFLEPYPQVRIVLSTTWVQHDGFQRASKRLPSSLQRRCVGTTFHGHMEKFLFREASRGMQIYSDVGRRCPRTWLALDDDYFGWPAFCKDRLIQTNEDLGISDPLVQEEIKQKFALHFAANA